VAFVNDVLESISLPTHIEVTMVHPTSSVTVREDEWLAWILGLGSFVCEIRRGIVHFVEDTGKVDWEVCWAVTAVGPSRTIRDMRFVISRVDILSIPAALEVELSTDTTGARCFGEVVKPGRYTVEVQAEEGNGLLFKGTQRRSLTGVSAYHAEVIGEDGGLPWLIGEQVVGDGAARYKLEGTIRVLEVQLREPVRRLVLLNAGGGTLRLTEVVRRRDLDSEIGTADDSVDMPNDSSGAYDWVSTLNDENVLADEEESLCGHGEGEQDDRR